MASALAVAACGDQEVVPVEDGGNQTCCTDELRFVEDDQVDLLFIVDDSPGMAGAQARLAASMSALTEGLGELLAEGNLRIAVTTTDVGNPACTGTGPEDGALQIRACTDHLEDFPAVEDAACRDHCGLEAGALAAGMRATATDDDPEARVRPWIEVQEGLSNLPEGVSVEEGLACVLPQGITGCEFESPLSALERVLERLDDPDDPAFGFRRDEAALMVVFVTDEADCSANPLHADTVFDPELSNRVFWSDPEGDAPTSAVCWNAGVRCNADNGEYEWCRAVDRDAEGDETMEAESAVLHPVQRTIDRLDALERVTQELEPDREFMVVVIAGVPEQGPPVFPASPDAATEIDYGIGAGCEAAGGGLPIAARPPVRLADFAAAFPGGSRTQDEEEDDLHSICSPSYDATMARVGRRVAAELWPMCVRECAKDTDAASPGLQPACTIDESVPGEGKRPVPPCEGDGGIPEGASTCFELVTGDERDPLCVVEGFNLQVRLLHPVGHQRAPGTSYGLGCELSEHPEDDCAPGQ